MDTVECIMCGSITRNAGDELCDDCIGFVPSGEQWRVRIYDGDKLVHISTNLNQANTYILPSGFVPKKDDE